MRAKHRALKYGGRLAFFVITTSPDISPGDIERIRTAGRDDVHTPQPYDEIVGAAGFSNIVVADHTEQYRDTLSAWLSEWDRARRDLLPLVGQEEFEDRQSRRRASIADIDSGLLIRQLVTATK